VIYKYPDTAILVFCKAPIAGQVKTRLMPDLSAEQARDVHIELSQRILKIVSQSNYCPVQLWCSPDITDAFFQTCTDDYPLSLHTQKGNDLGARMHHAISHELQSYSKVLLVGCDCPSLTIDDFDFAINKLNTNDVVIAPAEDGGYVMIGMKQANPTLFRNITWSDEHVLDTTRQRAKKANLNWFEIQEQWDVDVIDDLNRYQKIRAEM